MTVTQAQVINEGICHGVAPVYAEDLSVPILDRGRNSKERESGSSTMYSVPT